MHSFSFIRSVPIVWALLISTTGGLPAAGEPSVPARAVLFVIDGLHWQAPERLGLENLKRLADDGASVRKAYLLMPHHPVTGAWAEIYTASIPNPVMLAGTLFIQPGQKLIQNSFYPERLTAHVTNTVAYTSLNPGNAFSMVREGTDAEAVEWALRFLEHEDIRFMRIHLQDTGRAGYLCANADEDVPWSRNIWGEGSPYKAAAREADRLLGVFIEGLEKIGKWEDTLLVATSDHGQAETGWHPNLPEEGWVTPLIFHGPRVAQGRTLPYAEHTDIAPTIAEFMGVPPPSRGPGAGQVLREVYAAFPFEQAPPRRPLTRELNEVLRDFMLASARLRIKALEQPSLETIVLQKEREFYGLDRFLEWSQAGSLENLIAINRQALAALERALAD